MSNTTVTLQNVVNLASTHADLLPLAGVGGYQNEPALSLCNDVLQELLSTPTAWKFNRVEMPFLVTAPNRQDYQFAGAVAFTLGSTSQGAGIGLASNNAVSRTGTTVTVTTLENHNFAVGDTVYMFGNSNTAFNSTFTQTPSLSGYSGGWVITSTPTSTSFVFTHAVSGSATTGAPGITDFGWLEDGTMREVNTTSSIPNSKHLEAVHELMPEWAVSNPRKVCVLRDNGDGTVKIRFQYVPGSTTWAVNLVYQAKAPLKTALSQSWAPFPDEYGYVYRQGLLARMYRYLDSPKQLVEDQKLQRAIARAVGADDREMSDQSIYPSESLMDSGSYNRGWL